MRIPKKIIVGAFGGILLAGLIGAFTLLKTDAAGQAGTYQIPCYPYGNPNYAFSQNVSGWGYHVGEDVCHQEGTPVYATADGYVVYSARTPDSYRWGNLIMIEHSAGPSVSLYGHLGDNRAVAAGQWVQKGQLLGYVGAQGPQNGYWEPHLHFGIHPGTYGARAGTYATWVHGYENPCCNGWVAASGYVNPRRAAYDFLSYQEVSQRSVYYNDGMDVTIKLRNTGSQTWHKDGANPVRLGTAGPRDRISGFSQNGTADGWVSPTRIEMQADTPPDQVATFTFRIESNQQPGNYDEQFEPVVEGVGWMPDRTIHIPFTLQPPGWRGQLYSQRISATSSPTDLSNTGQSQNLLPGQKVNLKMLVKNTGELPWDTTGANPVRLGTSNPLDRFATYATIGDGSIPASENWLSHNRASDLDGRYDPNSNSVVADSQITNGEIGVFSTTVTIPDEPGQHQEYLNPVVEGKTWMPDLGANFTLGVADRGYHFQYVSQSQSTNTIGQTATKYIDTTLQIKNTGRESWPVGGALRLATEDPRDHNSLLYMPSGTGAWVSPNRPATINRNVSSNGKSTVDVGEVAEFTFRMSVGDNLGKGNYRLYVQPVMDGVTRLPEPAGVYFPFSITANVYDNQFVSQSFSGSITNFPKNSSRTATLRIKNNSRTAWPVNGANAVHLAPIRPMDRQSGFYTGTGSNPWLTTTRASAIDGRYNSNGSVTTGVTEIAPGETAQFVFDLTATPNPGTYNEYFGLVMEGVTWLPDYGIYFPLTVTGAGGSSQAASQSQPMATPTILVTPTP